MKKFLKRWYEKNECLSAFMCLIRDLEQEKQAEIAVDILLEIPEIAERDYKKIVKKISQFDPRNYKRWYDKNPSVHFAIESLRDLNEEQLEPFIIDFSSKILNEV